MPPHQSLPNLRRAIELGRDAWAHQTIVYAFMLGDHWRVDRPLRWWMDHLEDFDRAHADLAAPPASESAVDATRESAAYSPVEVQRAKWGTLPLNSGGSDDDR